jgi:hypothetical protein
MDPERMNQFKADVEAMKLKTGRAPREAALQAVSAAMMVVGIVVGIIGYNASLNTDISAKGQLDASSYLTLAVVGLAVTVAGTGMFIRYSLAKFLRIWLLRQSYETQSAIERLAPTTAAGPD